MKHLHLAIINDQGIIDAMMHYPDHLYLEFGLIFSYPIKSRDILYERMSIADFLERTS